MKHKVYCCGTDAAHHIPDDAGGIRIYFDAKSLKDREKCWKECGITELILDCDNPVEVEPEDWKLAMKNARTSQQIAWDYVHNCPKKIYKDTKSHLSDAFWGIRELISTTCYRFRNGKR